MLKSTKVKPVLFPLPDDMVDGWDMREYRKGARLFSQGDEADAIFLIQSGKIKVTVRSSRGVEVVLAVMGPRDSLGEGCLAGVPYQTSTASCLEATVVVRIGKREMLSALRDWPQFAESFLSSLLARNLDLEEDLCDKIFDQSEKRLARVLLKLARIGTHNEPRVSQETLAEIVGMTRSRVNLFMSKFRRMGVISYRGKGDILVKPQLLTEMVLHD